MTAVQEIAFVKMEPAFRNLFVADLELDVQKRTRLAPVEDIAGAIVNLISEYAVR